MRHLQNADYKRFGYVILAFGPIQDANYSIGYSVDPPIKDRATKRKSKKLVNMQLFYPVFIKLTNVQHKTSDKLYNGLPK